ncbi:MAG TPA: hypothetical protein PLQ56_01390 [Aggregatilineales bacterium]|nr:hypothetical protein [Aggregatilineales bacterium]
MNLVNQRRISSYIIIICGLLLMTVYHIGFGARYSMEKYGERPRQSIGTLTTFSNEGAYWFVGSMALLFVLYGWGFWAAVRASVHFTNRQRYGMLALVIFGGSVFSLILLPMYPVDASDVYDYIIRGRISAVYELNPMLNTPDQIMRDPFYRFASWRRTASAYGPAWEMLAHMTSTLTANATRNQQVIAYKLLAITGYGLTALFLGLTLQRIAPQRLVTGLYLFLWNPLVIYMTAGTGHNDALMTASMALAVYCLSRRWYIAATFAAILGTLIKFIPVLLIPIIALVALRELGRRQWLRYVITSALICGFTAVALYAPYWHGWDTLRIQRRELMYTGSAATVIRQWLMFYLDGAADLQTLPRNTPNSNALLANGTLLLFGLFYLWQLAQLWRDYQPINAVRITARIILAYLLIASLWFHAWYAIWLIALIALLEDTPLRRLSLIFSYLVTWQAFLYNYILVETRAGLRLPWLDVVPVIIYMGYAWLFISAYHLSTWQRRRRTTADDKAIGGRLKFARQSAGLTLSSVSDELAIRYDYLEQYEDGERPLRLDHGRLLAQRFGLTLSELLGTKA